LQKIQWRYTTTVNFLNGKINKIISAIKGE